MGEFKEENWVSVHEKSDVYEFVSNIVCRTNNDYNIKLSINDVYVTTDLEENYYVADLYGGLNGHGKWNEYLEAINDAFFDEDNSDFQDYKSWLIDLENDCLDDVFHMRVGFTYRSSEVIKKRELLSEIFDWFNYELGLYDGRCGDSDEDKKMFIKSFITKI